MPFFILYSLDNHHLHLSFPDYSLAFFNCLKIASIVYQVSETAHFRTKNNTNPRTFEKERSTNSCCTKSSRSSARNYLLPDYINPGAKVNILAKEYRYFTIKRRFFKHIAQVFFKKPIQNPPAWG